MASTSPLCYNKHKLANYESFAKGLQSEIAEAVASRPVAVTPNLFKGKVISDVHGNEQVVDEKLAMAICYAMVRNGYVDNNGALTDKYYEDKANNEIKVADKASDCADAVIRIVDSIYDERAMQPENAREKNVELRVDESKMAMPEFKALWNCISPKSMYVVDFDTDELVKKAIVALNERLDVPKIFFKVETGVMDEIQSKDALLEGEAFSKSKSESYDTSKRIQVNSSVKYDLVGKLVDGTGLTRKTIVQILTGINKVVFNQFKNNPEEFIVKAAGLINDEKATAIIQHITYNILDDSYGTDIFTEPTIKGKLGANAMKAQRHLYDFIVYDSEKERSFAAELDINTSVAVYVKGQKMLMLIGRGGEGKSRIGLVLQALLGANMATRSIAKIESSRFARADLEHELVMLDDDMKLEALPQTNHIKAIVTAELPMDLERKGQQNYQGDLYVRFLGFGNGSLKALYDRSEGFFRRQIILTTKPKDANRVDDPFIAEKMCEEAEGVFIWCLEGLRRLISNGYRFTLSERAHENMAEAVSDGNNAVDFMKSEGYIRLKADAEASSRDVYAVYRLWCEDNALNPLSARSLSMHLIENREVYGIEQTNKIYLPGGRRVRGFIGIELLQRAV